MRRWLALALGLAAAGLAAWALFGLDQGLPDPRPHDHIDDASRAALREVLREEPTP